MTHLANSVRSPHEPNSYVGQEPVLFSGSIADNIRSGKPDATEAEVRV